ncbi:MAG: hypothetical protein A3K22_04970 [Deltaproteobacteria bacterium RBG_16_42_7]|nr:MAG: hypothetical protein A3K22_04970 [Deltaproteobacteria bacterium RBG_16_42_7]
MKKQMVTKYQRSVKTLVERFREKQDTQNELHKGLQSVLNDLSSNMAALETIRQNPDPRMPKEGHILNVSKMAGKLQAMTEEMRKAVIQKAGEVEKGLAAEMSSRSGLKPGPYAIELRQRFFSMSAGDRVKTIQNLIDSRDGASLDAILNAPPVLTGLLPQDITSYREQYFQTACPELYQARETYRDLKSHIDAAIDTVQAATTAYSDPLKLRDLEASEAASAGAQAQLEGGSHV